jgi:tetratricopeptide (TPR) repeat protein
MRGVVVLATAVAFMQATIAWAGPAGAPTHQQLEWCEGINEPSPDNEIVGCTAAIQAGEFIGNNISVAFQNRGIAYENKGRYDFAISDFDEAIRLDPADVFAYYNRGIAKQKIGDIASGKEDIARAKKLDPEIGQ